MKTTLKAARTATGLSKDDVAALMKVTRITITRWESDPTSCKIDQLKKLCGFYGISLDDIELEKEQEIYKRFEHLKKGAEQHAEYLQD
jgi:transcriptional regulator with XRE-family HTH domain